MRKTLSHYGVPGRNESERNLSLPAGGLPAEEKKIMKKLVPMCSRKMLRRRRLLRKERKKQEAELKGC